MLRQLTGLPIAGDTQMTPASIALWTKLNDERWSPPGPQDDTDDPAIIAFRAEANALVSDAKASYDQE